MTDVVTVDLDVFVPRVLNEGPNCPYAVALEAVRDTCIDFCDDTNFWQYDIDPMTAVSGVAEYDLDDIPAKTDVASVLTMTFQGLPVYPKTKEWLADNVSNWKALTETRPQYFMIPQPGKFRLVGFPASTIANAVDVAVALKPARDATTVYDRLYVDYLPDIVNGALSRLLAMKSKTWADEDLALYYQGLYEASRGSAKIVVTKGHTRASLFVTPRTLV